MPPATASILFAAFAKSIELSFVTVFVALLGQVLSRRAFRTKSKGITIAEMSMRSWVMQPGTMITHWETIRYAGLTALGVIALLTAFMAMFYTTASDALGTILSTYAFTYAITVAIDLLFECICVYNSDARRCGWPWLSK